MKQIIIAVMVCLTALFIGGSVIYFEYVKPQSTTYPVMDKQFRYKPEPTHANENGSNGEFNGGYVVLLDNDGNLVEFRRYVIILPDNTILDRWAVRTFNPNTHEIIKRHVKETVNRPTTK